MGALRSSSWTGISVASYPNGLHLTVQADLEYGGKLYSAALQGNPNCIYYVSGVIPEHKSGQDSPAAMDAVWNNPNGDNYYSKKFHEALITAAQAKYGTKALMLPFGHAMAKLNEWIKSGKTNVLTSPYQLYKDYIHLSDQGSYFLAMVQYAVMFQSDPHGATRTFQAGDHQATMTEAFAKLAQDVAWETVKELSTWTGVGSTDVVPPASAFAVRTMQNAAGPANLYTITGRAVAGRTANAGTGVYVLTRDGIRIVMGTER